MSALVKDPVCGMEIEPEAAAGKVEHQGQTYYFCSAACKKSFENGPHKYAGPSHDAQHSH